MNMRSISSQLSPRRFWQVFFLVLAALLLLSSIALAQAGLPALDRWVMGAGGGPAETDTIRLDGTFGQPITGQSGGGAVALSAGFWTVAEGAYPVFLPMLIRYP